MTKINNITNKNYHDYSCIHNTWNKFFGAFFDCEKNCNVKLFAYNDIKKITIEIKRKHSQSKKYEMTKTSKCIWQCFLPKEEINSGDRYRFIIERQEKEYSVKDPCSMWQDSYFKWSRLYNHLTYKWTDSKWVCNNNPRKISRIANETNKLLPVDNLRIYELHIGTFTKEGTFKAAKSKLKNIAELHFNAIEIMPVENTYSFNWGYDGVDKYAPNHTYGTPDELKEFINHAHKLGLNVIMDIVPNHLGPDIAQLPQTGPYIEGENCFGYKFNFEKDEFSPFVRDFIIGAALNWLINYHCDGLRVDMTKFMCSDFTMKQMIAELNYHCPHAFLIAEDGRDNDSRVTNPFSQSEIEANELMHEDFINKIKNNNVSLSNLGFNTEWDFLFHKQIAASVLGSWDCRIKSLAAFDYSIRAAQTRVKYSMSHDEIGNIDGTRLITKIMTNELNLYNCVCDCARTLKCKIAAHSAQRILVSFLSGELEKMSEHARVEFYKKNNLTKYFSVNEIYIAYKKAIKMHNMAIAKIYSIPGPKMIFQGDESGSIAYFKFFRKFSTGPEPSLEEKGYKPGISAFMDSKLTSIKVAQKYKYINQSVENLISDLNRLNEKNIALSSGQTEKTTVHESNDIHTIYCRKIYNEVFSVSNFSNKSYKKMGILFPKGQWREILNTDDIRYGSEGRFLNPEKIHEQFSYISINSHSVIFFEKI